MAGFQAIFLAVIQGITEFLPISSSGHLVIFQKIFGLQPPVLFDILVHVGTLGAVFFFFRKRLTEIIKGLITNDHGSSRLLVLIIIGSIPAAFFGVFLDPYIEEIFDSLKLVGFSLLLTAILLLATKKTTGSKDFNQLKRLDSFIIGLFQALAILPGVSRSGSTISAALLKGFDREKAFEFSFFLAIPAIIGALVFKIPDLLMAPSAYLFQGLLGMIIAGVVGCFSLKILKQALLSKKLWWFSIYCFCLGLTVFLF